MITTHAQTHTNVLKYLYMLNNFNTHTVANTNTGMALFDKSLLWECWFLSSVIYV